MIKTFSLLFSVFFASLLHCQSITEKNIYVVSITNNKVKVLNQFYLFEHQDSLIFISDLDPNLSCQVSLNNVDFNSISLFKDKTEKRSKKKRDKSKFIVVKTNDGRLIEVKKISIKTVYDFVLCNNSVEQLVVYSFLIDTFSIEFFNQNELGKIADYFSDNN
jgi:hypothetical protein